MKRMGTPSRSATEREEEIRDEYLKTLQDLTCNSKVLIDVLTEVAEEAKAYASTIVDCIVEQLEKVENTLKLPILYLIDSIIKRVRDAYMDLFCRNIAKLFTKVYMQGDETVRQKLLKLRFTWNNVLPVSVLSQLDKLVQTINPNWPAAPSVHVNPKFVAISTNVTNANGVTTTRIAPVSSELINAVKRVRDPRLRKNELQEQNRPAVAPSIANSLNTNHSSSSLIKETKLPLASTTCVVPQTIATTKIEQKNDRRLLLEKKQIPASKVEVKEPVKKKVAVKVIGISAKASRSNSSSVATTATGSSSSVENKPVKAAESSTKPKLKPKSSTMAATVSTSSKEKDSPTNMCDMIKDVLKRNEERRMERQKYSKEERNKRLQAIAAGLIDSPDCENTLAEMAEKYPKIVPILITLMEKCKGDSTPSDEEKKPTTAAKKSTSRASASKSSTTKRDKNTSPKTIPKAPAISAAPVTTKASSVNVSVSTTQISLPPSTTIAAPVTSTPSPIIAPATVTEVESTPKTTSIPFALVNSIVTSVPSNVLPTSISSLADKLIPTTLQSISVTTSVTSTSTSASSPATISVLSPVSVASSPSPVLPIPPPAPIISSTAAAAEQSKTQDVDYRQLFGFQILPVPSAAAAVAAAATVAATEDESKSVIEVRSEDDEIIDVDALPSVPPAPTTSVSPPPTKPAQKRKKDSKKHRSNHSTKKRRTSSSSNDSVASKCSIDSGTVPVKRPIAEVVKIAEEEGSRSPETDVKKVKPNDSFYSQVTAETVTLNEEKPPAPNLIIMSVSESSRPKTESPPMFPKFESKFGAGYPANHEPSPTQIQELPPTDMNLVDMIDDDPVRSINIDGVSREIRHYGSTAVVFMNWDDPRDISFFNGVRNVIIDDKFGIPCTLNAPEIETLVYGVKHRFRLGVPTRELYVNGVGYECYFGGPPIRIRLNYKTNYIKLEGPPPSVNIGTVKRVDIVAGKIHIIIDDQYKHPVYLDAKPQYFFIDKKPVTLLFINGLRGVLINNVQFRTDFGGPSQSFKFMGKVYQFRFTVLPHGIMPGINLSQMMVLKLPSPPPLPPQFQFSVTDNLPTPPMPPAALATAIVPPAIDLDPPPVTNPAPMPVASSSGANNILDNISIDELFQKLVASGIVPNVENKNEESSDTVKHVDFNKSETLKQRQPAVIKMLYSGIQCGSCGLRFPAEQTLKYSQHLDWHFRLNRKGKDGARTIHSRKWYYSRNDWIKFQEMEDNTDRGTSWFDNHPVTEYTEEVLEDVPCIPAGSNQYAACELCRDRFEQFYNDESDEWQLRNAIKVDDLIYHPICYSDHQQKLEQEKLEAAAKETPVEDSPAPVPAEEPVVEKTEPAAEPASMDYDDDSDIEEVQLIEQPIEEIIINDENDYDEPNLETLNTEEIIAAQQEIAVEELPDEVPKPIKIEEPEDTSRIVDISDGGLEPSYDDCIETVVDSPQTKSGHEGVVNMDGNIELMDSPAQIPTGSTKIKINISKNINEDKAHSPRNEEPKNTNGEDYTKDTVIENLFSFVSSTTDTEKLVPVEIKSRIKDAKLNIYPAVNKGTEKSGLCTIM